jgi:hypothetical protein
MINRLPGEVLLEIFDYYRQSIDQYVYDHRWRRKYAWLNLAHVCRKWRAVIFASSSRLDLNIIVGPKKPGQIKRILSGHLPIFIDYLSPGDITDSTLWRMRAALRHRDRLREISFGGNCAIFEKFIRVANHHFPALESLVLCFPPGHKVDIPGTFLRGPDQSDLSLRRLSLSDASLESVSGLLLSATALTDLTLNITVDQASFGSGPGAQRPSLLTCLEDMQSLRSLNLTAPYGFFQSNWSHRRTLVRLSKLTRFHYSGPPLFLDNITSELSAPSLQDAHFELNITAPLSHLSRVIDDLSDEFRSVSVTFDLEYLLLLSSTHSRKIDRFKPSFRLNMNISPFSITSIINKPPTKLAMAEELALFFPSSNLENWRLFSLRNFLRWFRSVRVLRVDPFTREVALCLQMDDGQAILPVLEEIELSVLRLTRNSDEEYLRRTAEAL